MAQIGITWRIYYIAKNYAHGLNDIQLYVVKPNGVSLGPYLLSELNDPIYYGIYYFDFVDADLEGNYLFLINSASTPKKDAKFVEFSSRTWSTDEKKQLRYSLGINGDKTQSVGGLINTVSDNVDFIKNIEGGKWEIKNNQMIFYSDDNITEVARFNLFDNDDVPTEQNVIKRERL